MHNVFGKKVTAEMERTLGACLEREFSVVGMIHRGREGKPCWLESGRREALVGQAE